MKYYKINDISDLFFYIRESNLDRNFISLIGASYEADEPVVGACTFEFNEDKLRDYSFLFHFFNVIQVEYSSENFNNIIKDLVALPPTNITPIVVKEILFRTQLDNLKEKYNNNLISEDVYKKLRANYLD